MGYYMPERILKNKYLTSSDKLVFMFIRDKIEREKERKITTKEIAEECCLTEMTVNRSVKRLAEQYEILVQKDIHNRKYYSLVDIYG